MKIDKDLEKTRAFDPEKVDQCYSDLIEVFQKHRLTIGEILIAYGNLGYSLGASMEGYGQTGPGVEELKKLYYSNPTPGVGLMLQGLTITTWYDQYAKMSETEKDIGEKETI